MIKTNIVIFILGLTVLLGGIYQLDMVKKRFPWVNNQVHAFKFELKAKKYSPADYRAKRYRAIANALRQGKTNYQFETGPLPPMGQ